jgi:ElaB/YqjD/DUF883 family membrane-anchored ribosome-binding protein
LISKVISICRHPDNACDFVSTAAFRRNNFPIDRLVTHCKSTIKSNDGVIPMTNFTAARGNFQDTAAQAAQTAGDVVRDKAAQAGDALKQGADRVEAEADAAVKKVRERVSTSPMTALAATLAIGAIAGYLVGRR